MAPELKRSELDWSLVSENIRTWRQAENMTQTQLATQAGLAEMTILTAEKGVPVSMRTLRKIALALDLDLLELCVDRRSMPVKVRPYAMHRSANRAWIAMGAGQPVGRSQRIRSDAGEAERRRLASLGFATAFMHSTEFVMPAGPGMVFMELFARFDGALNAPLYEDAILYCVEGDASVGISGDVVSMSAGDAMGYVTERLEYIEPAPEQELPIRLIWIGANRVGKIPKGGR